MYLSRQQILEAKDVVTEEVYVPEWGGKVLVKGMTGEERDKWEQYWVDKQGEAWKNVRAKFIARTVVDENGKPVFKEADVEALGQKSAKALDRIYAVAAKLSGIRPEDVKELEKNLKETISDTTASK